MTKVNEEEMKEKREREVGEGGLGNRRRWACLPVR